jgi:outer membrane protein OmpA-like peptidoglycan-associated protein
MTRDLPVLVAAMSLPLLAGAADPPPDGAKVLSTEQIQQALQPPAMTRSFAPRGLTRTGTAEAQPAVNLNIPFEINSSTLRPQAAAQLKQLEMALTSATLGKDRFMVAGHTDAKGSAAYNKQLSLKRAEAVKHFLVSSGLDPKRLETVGYGSDRLLVPDKPADGSNRRVEIRDLGSASP